MVGLAAIEAHNGWAIALVGIMIVFTGLVFLSFAVSQLHRLLYFLENPKELIHKGKRVLNNREKRADQTDKEIKIPLHLVQAERQMRLLTDMLDNPFPLPKLIHMSEKRGLPRPYATVNALLEAKRILPDGTGFFMWCAAS